MKRLITFLFCLFVSCFSYAANKMSMVTYFPVPYVAYSQVNVDQQLDVGLTSTCTMNLGCRESGTNLNANKVNLKSGKLELNQGKGVLGEKILLGSGSGNGKIQFSNVRIQGGDMQSLNAQEMNVKELKLFGHKFPPCKGKGGSDGQMSWTELSLKGAGTDKTELYLVCGKAETNVCQPPKGQSYQEECPNSTKLITYTWDSAACEYKTSGVCLKKCLTNFSYCGTAFQFPDGVYSPIPQAQRVQGLSFPHVTMWNQMLIAGLEANGYRQLPYKWTLGTENASCEINQRYFSASSHPAMSSLWAGGNEFPDGRSHLWGIFPYAMCLELEDCSTPVKECRSLADETALSDLTGLPLAPGGQI